MKKKVIVVDDDQGILEVIKIILEEENYEVVTIDEGKTIVKRITEEKPDVVLLDIWMSGQDGGEIAKQLKSNDETKNIPIIMVSAKNDTEKVAQDAGADDFITKPFDMDVLLEKVKKLASK